MKALTMTLLAAGLAAAQTTFTSSTPFQCDANTEFQATNLPQNCRGVPYDGTTLLEFRSPSWFQLNSYPPIPQPIDIYSSHIVSWDELVKVQDCSWELKSCAIPGKYAFTWIITDANGVVHTGTVSGEWTAKQLGSRGWWYPILLSRTLTINN